MRTLSLDWSNIIIPNNRSSIATTNNPFLDLSEAIYMYTCCLLHGNKMVYSARPLYIGQVYKRENNETVRNRLLEHLNDDITTCTRTKCNSPFWVGIKIAKILLEKNENLSAQLIDQIECCLIRNNQPLCNTVCKDNYNGDSIQIVNLGDFDPLLHTSSCTF